MNWSDALSFAEKGFNAWAAKDHNRKWVRKIDGTPIKNDLLVNIATAIAEAHVTAQAHPAPIAGLEPVASLLDELREYTALRYAGDCKCGNCQLVPRATLDRAIQTMAQLEAHAAEQVRPLVEALEGLIEAVELDADEGLEGIGSYTGARLTDAKNAIRARGQV